MKGYVAESKIAIHASPVRVWAALTTPALVKSYLMGADVESDWKIGSRLTYTGEYQGKPFEEKGVIQKIEPGKILQATHFSATSGKEDKPENYAMVTWELTKRGAETIVSVSQDSISTKEGVAASRSNWDNVLVGLKRTSEQTLETPAQTRPQTKKEG
ncbi:MAG: hypothetical protein JWM82_1068 [Myxococcales bacterium]|nr:hypothetical protein [Myxococcales bacterium]